MFSAYALSDDNMALELTAIATLPSDPQDGILMRDKSRVFWRHARKKMDLWADRSRRGVRVVSTDVDVFRGMDWVITVISGLSAGGS